jgi:hypothetical protein
LVLSFLNLLIQHILLVFFIIRLVEVEIERMADGFSQCICTKNIAPVLFVLKI